MWKIPLFTMILATMFLGGCNWGNRAADETPMNDLGNDVRRGVDDVEDAVTPGNDRDVNGVDRNGTVNEHGTVNENGVVPEVRTPNNNVDVNGNRSNVNDTNDVVDEKVEVR